jgi:hypothetical protein
VKEDYFEVTLTFKKLPAPLHIPFAALTAFFDPGVQFGLQFRAEGDAAKPATGPVMVPNAPSEPVEPPEPVALTPAAATAEKTTSEKGASEKPAPGEVVSLDSFRKK